MKIKCKIVFYSERKLVNYYTVKLLNQRSNETNRFINRFQNKEKGFSHDIFAMISWLERIGNIKGAKSENFRPEKRAKGLPPPIVSNKLRLYCIRLNEELVILGNGGIKTSQKVQESPDCYPHFQFMNKLEKELTKRIRKGSVKVKGKELTGNLNFEIET